MLEQCGRSANVGLNFFFTLPGKDFFSLRFFFYRMLFITHPIQDTTNDILKGFLVCLSVQLPPHKFIQMGCPLCLVHAQHTLKSALTVLPIALNGVGACASLRVNEIWFTTKCWYGGCPGRSTMPL